MADEQLEDQPSEVLAAQNQESEAQKRIKQLSDKVRLTSEERDEKARLLQEETEKRSSVEKERDFYAGFSDVVSTYPAAKEFKDDILAKVKAGYSVGDATFAVLGNAGKLGGSPTPQAATMPAGGSATTNPPQGGAKTPGEMSQEERRAQLEKDLLWT